MAKAIPVSKEDWQYAVRVTNNQDFFNYMCRPYVAKASMPAIKVHTVEFFAKP